MQGIIVVQVSNQGRSQETENREHQMLREIEEEVERLERIRAEVTMQHTVLSQLRDAVREMLELSVKHKETKKSEAQPEPEKKEEAKKYKETPEKFDPEKEEPLSESMQKRLQIIEAVLKSVAVKLGEADMTSRFNQLGELHHNLENCLNCSDEKKGTMEHLVELEAAIGEALNFLSTSKLAARFNLLKELRQELEDALTESHTTAG